MVERGGRPADLREISKPEYAETKLHDAKALLARFLPDVLPEQPTHIRVGDLTALTASAIYFGPFKQRHWIFLNGDGKQSYVKGIYDELSAIHELTHQWHAEGVSPATWHTVNLEHHFTLEELKKGSFGTLQRKARKLQPDKSILLSDSITEGLAYFVELYISQRGIREAERTGDVRQERALKRILKTDILPNIDPARTHYNTEGFKLISWVHKRVGLRKLFPTIRDMDFRACNEIKRGTPAYKEIIQDPLRLPMRANGKKKMRYNGTRDSGPR